ncbi:hypothetical protein ABLN72_17170, partial [Mycobacterium tuberculosis]
NQRPRFDLSDAIERHPSIPTLPLAAFYRETHFRVFRAPASRWSPTTSGTAASRSAWSTCTPSARSPSGWPEPS